MIVPNFFVPMPDIRRRDATVAERRNGDYLDSVPHRVVLWHCATDDPGPDTKSHHAFPRQLYITTCTEPACVVAVQAGAVCRFVERG